MSNKEQQSQVVLVLCKAGIKPQMESFLKIKGFQVKTAQNYSVSDYLKFIIIDEHLEDWETIGKVYQTFEKAISVVSLTPVREMKRFLAIGGKAVISEAFFMDRLGQIFAKRLFSGEVSLHMDEVFGGNFLKYKNLKIMNHNRSGYYSDIISGEALEQDYNNVAIRGFIYNSIYYLSYLNQSGIAELPFDLEYAQSNKYFALQMVVTVKNFFLEYMVDSFGHFNQKNPLNYILRENLNLAHGFDITYLEKSNSIILTALWEKKTEIESSFSSFVFNNVKAANQIAIELDQQIEFGVMQDLNDGKINELNARPLPGDKIEPTEANLNLGTTGQNSQIELDDFSDEMVKGFLDLNGDESIRIKGTTEDLSEDAILVRGKVEDMAKNIFAKISGGGLTEDEKKIIVKGQIADLMNNEIIRIKGSPDAKDKLRQLASLISQQTGVSEDELEKIVVKGQKALEDESKTIVKGDSASYKEAILVEKLKRKEDEVKQLSTANNYLKGQLAAIQSAQDKLTIISGNSTEQDSDNLKLQIGQKKEYQTNDAETDELLKGMKSSREAEAFKKLAEREKELIEIAKNHELTLKKKELDFQGKEINFTRELEKLERAMKGKELLLNKTKEGVKAFMEKKELEIRSLTERLGSATLRMNTTVEDPRIHEFQQENRDLHFQITELKKKLISETKDSSKSVDLKEFNEQMTRMKGEHQKTINEKQALSNQTVALQKETDILKERIKEMEVTISDLRKLPYGKVDQGSASPEVQTLKSENTELKKRIKELESKTHVPEKVPQTDAEKANAELSKMLKERDTKILSFTDKIQELESKVSSTLRENETLRNQSVDATKGKVAQLDAATKKLTSDLGKAQTMVADAKKEMAKLKAENTGLKNQFDKLKNDYEKATGKKVA